MSAQTTVRTAPDVLPLPALLALAAATFVMVTAEMLPASVLVPMSAGLGVPEAWTGQLVSAWALTVVVASLPLVRLTRGRDRRLVVVGGLLVLAASSLGTALGPTFGVVLAARLAGACAVGLLWATANAHVADLVPGRLLGRAVAILLAGATAGLVLGTPLARLVADVVGWRWSFALLAAAAVLVAALVLTVVPGRAAEDAAAEDGVATAGRPLAPVLVLFALTGAIMAGHHAAYTFLTRLGETAAGLLPGGMSTLLLGYGLASAVGLLLAGRVASAGRGLVLGAVATVLALLGLAGAERAALGLGAVLLLGAASGAVPPLSQTEILDRAGRRHRDLAAALIPVVFNGGIALGAGAASMLVGASGPGAVPVPAAGLVALATAGLLLLLATTPAPGPAPAREPEPCGA
ncbi:hypothetical protein GCM10009584_16830 [Ornithinimicrobium humiphilum]|uniref:Putative MFS family arabinose efflux permease n=1 Tax=Ornithinimicrobium humiphilum TaxID=125288 RepID=A0A543KL14_9MICO|nr:MFS transporter [Ornithinimicrobium humiphilum]TQM95776.1 putative MFS family arabinose efflux permease [Ornithinimicrobium humiphilum]